MGFINDISLRSGVQSKPVKVNIPNAKSSEKRHQEFLRVAIRKIEPKDIRLWIIDTSRTTFALLDPNRAPDFSLFVKVSEMFTSPLWIYLVSIFEVKPDIEAAFKVCISVPRGSRSFIYYYYYFFHTEHRTHWGRSLCGFMKRYKNKGTKTNTG
jgi:hypothetical protein